MVNSSAQVGNVPIVVVDVETTGLSPQYGDRVCEIALIRRDPGGGIKQFASLVDPQRPISAGAFAVNRITPDMLAGAPRFCEILQDVEALLAGAVFLAHNAPFDLGFVQNEFALCDRSYTPSGILDTRLLSRRYLRLHSNSLRSVAQHLRVPQPQAHRALADCETTLSVFDAIVERAQLGSLTLQEVNGTTRIADSARSQAPELPGDLSDLIRREGAVEIVYLTPNGSRSRRSISEVQVSNSGDHIYLYGFCSLRREERRFRLDRILEWNAVRPKQNLSRDDRGRAND